MARPQTLDQFTAAYLTGNEIVIEPDPNANGWPNIVVKAGDYTAVIQLMYVAAGTPDAHLCIDVHPFADGDTARASVFGMDNGRKVDGFGYDDTEGTSHGLPAAPLVAVLIGKQS
jgi:hypothetical protein